MEKNIRGRLKCLPKASKFGEFGSCRGNRFHQSQFEICTCFIGPRMMKDKIDLGGVLNLEQKVGRIAARYFLPHVNCSVRLPLIMVLYFGLKLGNIYWEGLSQLFNIDAPLVCFLDRQSMGRQG